MIPRHISPILQQLTTQYPVVSLTGPRQSGKTTLIRNALTGFNYCSLEDPDHRQYALGDPRGFLDQFKGPVCFDEVQRTPDLFSYLQTRIDNDPRPGRYVLSGSQNFLLLRSISQTLAGRVAILHLLPFSLAELWRRPALAPESLADELIQDRSEDHDPFSVLHTGFYPRIHDTGIDAQRWLRGYFQTYIQRDVRELVNVGDLDAFGRFIRLCAGRTGQLLNLSSLGADCGVSHTTARRWLSMLEASFIIFLLRPHVRHFRKRLVKSPKLYFIDTGLLCYLLRIRSAEDLRYHASRGSVFENFVVNELLKAWYHRGAEPALSFWRDSSGHEIDLIIEDGQRQIPIEVKSGQTVASDFLDGLRYWRNLAGDPKAPAALIYGGARSFSREGVSVRSWMTLAGEPPSWIGCRDH